MELIAGFLRRISEDCNRGKMRILQVNDTTEKYGGAEVYVHNLLKLLRDNGHKVEIFGSEKFQNKLSFITRFYDPFIYFKFSKKIKEFKPDIIHCHNICRTISPSVLHAAKKHKIPIVMTVHDFHLICPKTWFIYKDGKLCKYGFGWRCLFSNCHTFKRGWKYFIYHLFKILKVWLHRKIIRNNINIFITPSEILGEWIKKSLDVKNVKTVPNFIDISNIKYTPIKDTKNILYVGRLSKEKGLEYLIKAMPVILDKIPDSKLIIVGRGPEKEKLERLSQTLKIERKIMFKGYVSEKELMRCYQDSEIVVVPSNWAENFPLVTLEAMAYGRPIIVSDIFGLSERIKNNDVGFLFNPADPKDLADKIINLLSDFNLAKKMSKNARKKVEKEYSSETHYKELMKVYRGLL